MVVVILYELLIVHKLIKKEKDLRLSYSNFYSSPTILA